LLDCIVPVSCWPSTQQVLSTLLSSQMKRSSRWPAQPIVTMTMCILVVEQLRNQLLQLVCYVRVRFFSRSLMVSVSVSALGTTSIHFIEPGIKVNGQYYREDLLMQKLLPDICQLSDFYVFQQDSAPAHRARETVELLTVETPEFIPRTLWPPNSPDLNPVDYEVWSVMQEKVYKKRIKDIDKLHAHILTAWDEMDQSIIDKAVRQWCTRLYACIKAKGGHVEHKLSQ